MADPPPPNAAAANATEWLMSESAASLLPSLVLAADNDAMLEGFIRRTSNPELSTERARLARQLLIQLCGALGSNRTEDWKAIARALDTAKKIPVPPSAQGAGSASTTRPSAAATPRPQAAAATTPAPPSPSLQPTPAVAPPPRRAAAAPRSGGPRPGETSASSPAASPFPQAVSPPATPPATPERSYDPNESAETEAIDLAAVAQLLANNPSAMPFSAPAPGTASAVPPPSLPQGPAPGAGSTEGIDEAAIQAAIAGSYPLPAASVERLPLAVDQYAALVAREEAGVSVDVLHAEYRIDNMAHRKRLDEEFRAVFEQNPDLRAKFEQAFTAWRQYLRQQRR